MSLFAMYNDLIPYVMGMVVAFIVLLDFFRKLMFALNCLALWTTITIFIILRYMWRGSKLCRSSHLGWWLLKDKHCT